MSSGRQNINSKIDLFHNSKESDWNNNKVSFYR